MKQIKLFQLTDRVGDLTNVVNDWLEKHNDEICNVEITHRVTGRMDTTTVVMIEYEKNFY